MESRNEGTESEHFRRGFFLDHCSLSPPIPSSLLSLCFSLRFYIHPHSLAPLPSSSSFPHLLYVYYHPAIFCIALSLLLTLDCLACVTARWVGFIKDYDGGTLMECYIHPALDYLNVRDQSQPRHAVLYHTTWTTLHHIVSCRIVSYRALSKLSLSLPNTLHPFLLSSPPFLLPFFSLQVPQIVAAQRAFIYKRLKERSQ